MLYPVYVRLGDEQHAHGVTIPDFSGCFSAADEWQDLPAMIQEGIELWCEGQKLKMAKTNQFGTIGKNHEYDGGVWMLIDIDTPNLETESVTAVRSLLLRMQK